MHTITQSNVQTATTENTKLHQNHSKMEIPKIILHPFDTIQFRSVRFNPTPSPRQHEPAITSTINSNRKKSNQATNKQTNTQNNQPITIHPPLTQPMEETTTATTNVPIGSLNRSLLSSSSSIKHGFQMVQSLLRRWRLYFLHHHRRRCHYCCRCCHRLFLTLPPQSPQFSLQPLHSRQ